VANDKHDVNKAITDLFKDIQEKYGSDKSKRFDIESTEKSDTSMETHVTLYEDGVIREQIQGQAVCSAVYNEEDDGVFILVGGKMSIDDIMNMMSALIYSIEQDVLLSLAGEEEE